jgi:hypothetical protein
MSACSCGCQNKAKEQAAKAAESEKKSYVCYQCNAFKDAPAGIPAPECCGKKMEKMD